MNDDDDDDDDKLYLSQSVEKVLSLHMEAT
jgi:hypothetical protein